MNDRIEKLLEHVRVNEQIERLAKESGCTIDRLGYGEGNLEKFAELIVRECIERVRSQYIPVRDSTVEGRTNPFHPQLKVRTEREEGVIECGVNSVIALEELIQEQTDKWYEENILGVE